MKQKTNEITGGKAGVADAGQVPGMAGGLWRGGWGFAGLIVVATFLAYQPVWHAGFIWDDGFLLTNNPLIQQPEWWRVWVSKGVDYVPAASTMFWFEWHWWGEHPLGYHLVNVLLHALGAVLLWRVLRRLEIPGARLAAAIFALHPVSVESVAWIAERKNTLAMVFYGVALLCYLTFEDSGRRRWYWLAAGAFVLGIFSKTAIAPMPVVLLGMAWWRRGKITRQDVWRSILFFALAVAAAGLGIWIQRGAFGSFSRTADIWTRLAAAGWAVWFYLGKIFLPVNLIPVYPLWRVDEKAAWSYLPGVAVLAALAAGWVWRGRGGRGWLAAFGYFVALLLPVLGFVDITYMHFSLVADHWQYFAMIGPIALAAAGGAWAARRIGGAFLPAAACAVICLTLGILTWRQCRIYKDSDILWRTTLADDPNSFVALSSVGGIIFKEGRQEEAIADYRKALELEPNFFEARHDLASIYDQLGRDAEAIHEYQELLRLKLDFLPACNNLAWLLAVSPQASNRDGARAVTLALQAAKLPGGDNPSVLGTLAAAYAEAGQFDQAVAAAQKAQAWAAQKHMSGLASELSGQLRLYQARQAYRKPML